MKRWTGALLVFGVAAGAWADVSACGDKFFRIGRNMRYQRRYVAIHPSSVMIYMPRRDSPTARIKDLPKLLREAGHRASVVTTRAGLATALGAGGVEVVLAGLDDMQLLQQESASSALPPTMVPVLIDASKAEVAGAEAAHHAAIHAPDQERNEALAQIDHAIERHLKDSLPGSR